MARHGRGISVAVASVLALTGGCGGGGDPASTTPATGATPETLSFCATHIDTETAVRAAFPATGAASSHEDLVALLPQWLERAPDEVRDDVETQARILRDALESGDTSFLDQGSEYQLANDRVDAYLLERCPRTSWRSRAWTTPTRVFA